MATVNLDPHDPCCRGVDLASQASEDATSSLPIVNLALEDLYPRPLLPSELMDRIIDFCHEDSLLLSVASFVCRSWVPSCRFHLFENLIIYQDNVRGFVDLFQHNLCTIPRSVENLQLSIRNREGETFDWITDIFLSSVSGILSIQGLIINSTNENLFPSHIPPLLKSAFPSVTKLALYPLTGGDQLSLANIIQFIELFSDNLQTLVLNILALLIDDASNDHSFPRHLRNFTLLIPVNSAHHEILLRWLERHLPQHHLEQLFVYRIGGKHISHSLVPRYICNHNVSLLILHHWNLPQEDDYFDLSCFNNLEALYLFSPDRLRCSVRTILKTLESIRPQSLRLLCLIFHWYDVPGSQISESLIQPVAYVGEEQEKLLWSAVDTLLTSSSFSPTLKSVLIFSNDFPMESLLPLCHSAELTILSGVSIPPGLLDDDSSTHSKPSPLMHLLQVVDSGNRALMEFRRL